MALDMQSDHSDEELLTAFAAGDRMAGRVLVARLGPIVYRHALRLLGNTGDAEDVSQEAMIKLWKIAPEWQTGKARVSTWLYRVTANLAIDKIRARKDNDADAVAELVDDAVSVEEKMTQSHRADVLKNALMELPERQRQAVTLRMIDGLSNPEIADIIGVSVEAVESLTARAKRALKQILTPKLPELGGLYGTD